jgi:flagellar biosynthetic protein FlhB
MLTALAGWGMIGKLAAELALWLFAVMLVMGAADFLFQKWNHTQELKMTKQDVKDERRSMEGDPQIKGKRFKMGREIMRQRIGAAVPKADVIVTNPTHFSVAIQYDPETMAAPRVVAKGADELAMTIRHLARMHGVPILERPPLARALYRHVDVGREIHPQYYEAVAQVLSYVYRIEKEAGKARAPAPEAAAA